MVYIASVTVQVVKERIFCIVVAGGIHPVRTIQVVNFISRVRRIMFTLVDISCQITADTEVTFDSRFSRERKFR